MPRLSPLLALGLSLGLLIRPAHAEEPARAAAPAPAATAVWQPQPLGAQPWAQRPYTPILPALTRRALPGTERHSTGAMVTGIVLVGVAVIGLGAGTAVALAGKRSCGANSVDNPPPSPGGGAAAAVLVDCTPGAGNAVGMTMLVSSTILAGIGIPLWIFGSERVSRYPDTARPFTRPTLLVGPGSAGLRLSF